MTIDNAIKLIDSVGKLLGVIVWPAITLFILLRFGPALREFIANMSEFSLKAPGIEASGRRQQVEAAAALAAASVSHPAAADAPEDAARDARAAVQIVADVVTPRVMRRARQSTILWVDDRPDNNINERQALEALGISIVLSTSTDDAFDRLKRSSFDAIISDMGRPPDPKAGYTLLDKLRASGDQTPYIIYAGSRSPEHQAEARSKGAIGCTNRPNELFQMVLEVLGRWRET
jgi:CheY-like chemotaxis protein